MTFRIEFTRCVKSHFALFNFEFVGNPQELFVMLEDYKKKSYDILKFEHNHNQFYRIGGKVLQRPQTINFMLYLADDIGTVFSLYNMQKKKKKKEEQNAKF